MSFFAPEHLTDLLVTYGYGVLAAAIFFETFGLPLPGESLLIAAALYASTTGRMSIATVVVVAGVAATLGSTVGFALGRSIGPRRLTRYGGYVGLDERRMRLTIGLFRRHGFKVILLGRFVAFLRSLAAMLAGATRMDWLPFGTANVAGAALWSAFYGFGTYWLGVEAKRLATPVAIGFGCIAAVVVIAAVILVRRGERLLLQSGEGRGQPL
ncbi:MAG: DedA family protein [Acetobacteraceae bacterium]|nr:DedA family protein [Acetobacteraceae bacterium]